MKGSGAEKCQAQAKDVKGKNALRPECEKASGTRGRSVRGLLGFCGEKESIHRQNNAVDGAEDHESPICAMPQTGKDHGYKKISGGFPLAEAAAAQRSVKVVAQPGTQADVPAAPEVLQAVREEGLAEIDHEMEP